MKDNGVHFTMDQENLKRFVNSIGRCELFDEISERPGKIPRYFKAIQASLLAIGFDQNWVYGALIEALEERYL